MMYLLGGTFLALVAILNELRGIRVQRRAESTTDRVAIFAFLFLAMVAFGFLVFSAIGAR